MTFKRKSKGHLESLRSNLKDQGRNEGGGKMLGKGKCPQCYSLLGTYPSSKASPEVNFKNFFGASQMRVWYWLADLLMAIKSL